jgi:hypothetical protein
MGAKEIMEAIGKKLSGGMAGSAADDLKKRPKKIDDAINDAVNGTSPAPQSAASSSGTDYPQNPAGVKFKAGGMVAKKSQSVPPENFPTKAQTNGYKAGGMVRRGYGKARGA